MALPTGAPFLLTGAVIAGYGRGSADLGVPTANLPPGPLAATLASRPAGVYFGYARLEDPAPGSPAEDGLTHPAVLNVGRRPTFAGQGGDQGELSVEVHVLHHYASEFYGRQLRMGAGRRERGLGGRGLRPTMPGAGPSPTPATHALTRPTAAVGGFIRPETRFSGVAELLARIRADIGAARAALADPAHAGLRAMVE